MREIIICGVPYKIVEGDRDFGDTTVHGEIDYQNNEIFIRSKSSLQNKKITLLHEMLHAIFNEYGYFKERENEKLIRVLSISLAGFIKDYNEIVGNVYE